VTSFRWRGNGRSGAPDFGKDSTPRKARDVGHPFVHELVVGTWATRPTRPLLSSPGLGDREHKLPILHSHESELGRR
jgi:hypothetical protein